MHAAAPMALVRERLKPFERNRYYYGKMLDAYHFDLETAYHNQKRWLINRAVLGYGVVCGLDITLKNPYTIELSPGLAIDKWGREIVVPEVRALTIDPEVVARAFAQQTTKRHYEVGEKRTDGNYEEEMTACVQVMLCYHECLTDPTPVLAGDCHTAEPCVPGTIRETYAVTFTENCTHPHHDHCEISQIVAGGKIDYNELARWVTRKKTCVELPPDPCIRLAHLHLPKDPARGCDDDSVDITVRPIVYTNDLLFEILLGWQAPSFSRREK